MLKSTIRKAAGLFPRSLRKTKSHVSSVPDSRKKLLFVFDGRTGLWPGMGSQLYSSEPVFRDVIDRCDAVVREFVCLSILDVYSAAGKSATPANNEAEILHVAALGAYQLALFELWKSKGIRPDAVTGLCLGELLCLYAGNSLSLEESMRVICSVMRMATDHVSPSAIMVVRANAKKMADLGSLLAMDFTVCGEAGPQTTIIVCPSGEFSKFTLILNEKGIPWNASQLNWPYHTPMMSHDKEVISSGTRGVCPKPLTCDLYSCHRGEKIPAGSLPGLDDWYAIPRSEVRFKKAIFQALDNRFEHFLLFGPFDYLREILIECGNATDRKVHLINAVSLQHPELKTMELVSLELERLVIKKNPSASEPQSLSPGSAALTTGTYGEAPYDYADPYPFYDWLLKQERPVFSEGEGTWLIANHGDVAAALKDHRLSKQTGNPSPSPIDFTMLFRDAPDHFRLRGGIAPAFTPGNISEMDRGIERIVDGLLAKIENREEVDFIADFAMPLPVEVIADMLSVPSGDRPRLRKWSAATIPMTGPTGAFLPEGQEALGAALDGLKSYFTEHFRKGSTSGCPHLSRLAPGFYENQGFSTDELVGAAVLMMIAGHETTVNLLGNGLLCLLSNPDQLEILRRDPGLMEGAVEEMLRFESPVARGTFRVAKEPVEVSGVVIPQGALVAPLIGAANRDRRVFPDPEVFDINRKGARHIAFGNGPHYCLGAQLARLEARIAFTHLFKKFSDIRLANPLASTQLRHLDWIPSTAIRGLRSLPLELR